jgi:hypothetical protein
MRRLYGAHPAGFERLVRRARRDHAPLELGTPAPGLLSGRVDTAVTALQRDGIYVVPEPLDAGTCAELEALARAADCTLVGEQVPVGSRGRFDPAAPAAPRYEVEEQDLLTAPVVQRLLADESVLAVAQGYLGSAPVQDMVAMWWSAASPGGPSSVAAQKFHFDLDRLRFLKLFVYLTDVGPDSGPHVYVRGTRRQLAAGFRRDRRSEDGDVERAYGDAITTIEGARGTVFLADTRGLHKGAPPAVGHRLVFQVEFATSLFGQAVTRADLGDVVVPELRRAIDRYPAVFARFHVAGGEG